jgi:hypothetical protein
MKNDFDVSYENACQFHLKKETYTINDNDDQNLKLILKIKTEEMLKILNSKIDHKIVILELIIENNGIRMCLQTHEGTKISVRIQSEELDESWPPSFSSNNSDNEKIVKLADFSEEACRIINCEEEQMWM